MSSLNDGQRTPQANRCIELHRVVTVGVRGPSLANRAPHQALLLSGARQLRARRAEEDIVVRNFG